MVYNILQTENRYSIISTIILLFSFIQSFNKLSSYLSQNFIASIHNLVYHRNSPHSPHQTCKLPGKSQSAVRGRTQGAFWILGCWILRQRTVCPSFPATLHSATSFAPAAMPRDCRLLDTWNQNWRIATVLEGGAAASPTSISKNFSLAQLSCLLLLLSECVDPDFRAGKCVCKVHSDWWHPIFPLEDTSWSIPEANSDITPAGNECGQMANLASSLSSRMFYSVIKLTSDSDKI